MPEHDPRDKLAELDARIAAAKAEKAPVKAHQDEHHSQAHLAWRMVTELVVGLGIGFGIGYGLDGLFGTRPFLMVVFIFLGLAAGIKTMLRSARELQAEQAAQAPQDEREQDGD